MSYGLISINIHDIRAILPDMIDISSILVLEKYLVIRVVTESSFFDYDVLIYNIEKQEYTWIYTAAECIGAINENEIAVTLNGRVYIYNIERDEQTEFIPVPDTFMNLVYEGDTNIYDVYIRGKFRGQYHTKYFIVSDEVHYNNSKLYFIVGDLESDIIRRPGFAFFPKDTSFVPIKPEEKIFDDGVALIA